MSDEFDDLLGGQPKPSYKLRLRMPPSALPPPEPVERVRAPRKPQPIRYVEPDEVGEAKPDGEAGSQPAQPLPPKTTFMQPVPKTFLSEVYQMDLKTVTKRLAPLAPIAYARGGDENRPLYNFVDASSYLIRPSFSLSEYIKTVRVQDLPPHLSAQVNQAMLHRQTYETRAKNLWKTEDVQNVFREVFMIFRNRMQLLPETLRENAQHLSDDDIVRVRQMCDDIQLAIYEQLVELPLKQKTLSSIHDPGMSPIEVEGQIEFPDDDGEYDV